MSNADALSVILVPSTNRRERPPCSDASTDRMVSGAVLTAVTTAVVLGATHAIEPDHVAGIASLTSQYGDARLSALVGACFSVGHVALVVVWLGLGYGVLNRTTFPDWFDSVGSLGVAVVLGCLSVLLIASGLRTALLTHTHEHIHDRGDDGGDSHTHRHVHVFADADHDHGSGHDHGHGLGAALRTRAVGTYLKTGVVGALFTLSPPLSMIAFGATLFPRYGFEPVLLAVGAYAVSITLTMSCIGAGAGALFGAVRVTPRAYGLARAGTGLLVGAFAIAMLAGAIPGLG
jgi:nickel/cobalt transporter (NicO) family protein